MLILSLFLDLKQVHPYSMRKKQLKTPNLNGTSSSEEIGIQDGEENDVIVVKR